MKLSTTTLAALLTILLSGCTTYYYSTVKTTDTTLKASDNGGFTATKNDVSITYRFEGKRGNISLEIDNRTNEEFTVDWTRSFLIAENYTSGRNYADTTATVCAYSYNGYENLRFPNGNAPAISVKAQPRFVISPYSSARRVLTSAYPALAFGISPDKLLWTQRSGKRVKQLSFEPKSTPMLITCYLTLRDERSGTQIVFDNRLYVSDFIYSGSLSPKLMSAELSRGDTFFYRKKREGIDIPVDEKQLTNDMMYGVGLFSKMILETLLESAAKSNR